MMHQLTIQKIMEMQDAPDNTHVYLLQQGLFFHAFNQSAVFFQGVTGYKVRRVKWRNTFVEQLGIPCTVIDGALHRLQQQHPEALIDGTFYAPHFSIELPREVLQNLPYESLALKTPQALTPYNLPPAVYDILLTLNVNTASAERLRNTIRHLQRMICLKS